MHEGTPSELAGVGDFRYWKPDAQERALELLNQRRAQPWKPFYCSNATCNGHPHCIVTVGPVDCEVDPRGHPWTNGHSRKGKEGAWHCAACGSLGKPVDKWTFEHSRADQRPPAWRGDWLTWLLGGGRGSGKTRGGSELTHRVTKFCPRIILIAPTGPDLRETMVEGRSGILRTAPPGAMPNWEPSKKKLTWPNGCVAQGFSAEEPDRLRGPESGFIWADEPAHWPDTDAVWDNMQFGLRVKNDHGYDPKICATTTPKSTKWMKELVADPETITHKVSTYANLQNLAEKFAKRILTRYEGTRTGKQELHGELLEDIEGALWTWEMIQTVEHGPTEYLRIVVSVDPAGSANARSDETGIIVIGLGMDKRLYVLEDLTGKYSPGQWADKAVKAHEKWKADCIVAEKNYGGDMVEHTLENSAEAKAVKPRIQLVDSRRGKQIRAEPIVALYEKGKVTHVGPREDLAKLAEEQTSWIPGEGASPNRVDALVHGATELAKLAMPVEIASPSSLEDYYRAPTSRHLRAV